MAPTRCNPSLQIFANGTWTSLTIISLSRQMLVNDDIGAFSDLPRRMGAAAAAFEAQTLVDLLISNAGLGPVMKDTKTLFHSDHGNVSDSGGAPDETTLSAARLAMRKQTGQSGGLIVVEPRYVLVPSEQETSILKLLAAIQPTTTDDVNVFTNLVPMVEPRLTDAKRWYMVAAPEQLDGLEFAYLAGEPGPQISSKAGFEVDGVSIKVRLDFGAGFVEHRGWYSNAGQ